MRCGAEGERDSPNRRLYCGNCDGGRGMWSAPAVSGGTCTIQIEAVWIDRSSGADLKCCSWSRNGIEEAVVVIAVEVI